MRVSFFTLQIEDTPLMNRTIELANALVSEQEVEMITGSRFGERETYGISPRIMLKYLVRGPEEKGERYTQHISVRKSLISSLAKPFRKASLRRENKRRMIAAIGVAKGDVIISCDPLLHEMVARYGDPKAVKIALGEKGDSRNSAALLNACKGFDYYLPIGGTMDPEEVKSWEAINVTPKLFDGEDPMEEWRKLMRETEEKVKRR